MGGEEGEGGVKSNNGFNTDKTARNGVLFRNEGCKIRKTGVDRNAGTNWETAAASVRTREPLRRKEEVTRKSWAAWARWAIKPVASVGADRVAMGATE